MAYTPKQWVCGETITADGLNNIEEGIQEALEVDHPVLVIDALIRQSGSDWVVETEATLEEIGNAWENGKAVFARTTVAPTGYPEAYWERAVAPLNAYTSNVNASFNWTPYVGAGSNTLRQLAVDGNGWHYSQTTL